MNPKYSFKGWWRRTFRKSYNGTPEMFLAEMLFLEKKYKKHRPHPTAEDFAGTCFKVLRVNLAPYKSFEELKASAKPDNTLINQVRELDGLNRILAGNGIRTLKNEEGQLYIQLAYIQVLVELNRPWPKKLAVLTKNRMV